MSSNNTEPNVRAVEATPAMRSLRRDGDAINGVEVVAGTKLT